MPISSSIPPAETLTASAASGSRAFHGSGGVGTAVARAPIVALLSEAVFTTDLEGVITSFNTRWQPGSGNPGLSSKELVGHSLADFFGAGVRKNIAAALQDERFEGSARWRGKPDEDVDVEVNLCLTLLRDLEAAPVGILVVARVRSGGGASKNLVGSVTATTAGVSLSRREIDGTAFLIVSPIMHKFMGMVDRVAGHTETVLVIGETGTGKELVARTIHESSHRCKHALVDINCAALPEHLVESELFGYEKGAFSGAESSKPGLFELADKSTLFLDEIGELQPQVQVKLLRVLDGAPYYRLGGNKKITVDVRVVAATNQDLEAAVKEGKFRKDLYHRLSQFQLRVPPLRERPEDIAAMASHFLTLKSPDKIFTGDALTTLQAHTWPGNIRELRNLVAKLAMSSEDRQITGREVSAGLNVKHTVAVRGSGAVPLGNLENMEEQMIIRALAQTGGHRARAAEQLGISRRTLSRKLHEYAIDTKDAAAAAQLGVISEDQQKFFRAKVSLTVTLKNSQGKEMQVQAVNLSTGGMGLDSVGDPAGFGGLIDVSFLLPESETVIEAKGRLVWAEAGGRAGLRFVVVEPALFVQLQQWTNRKMKDEGWELPS